MLGTHPWRTHHGDGDVAVVRRGFELGGALGVRPANELDDNIDSAVFRFQLRVQHSTVRGDNWTDAAGHVHRGVDGVCALDRIIGTRDYEVVCWWCEGWWGCRRR